MPTPAGPAASLAAVEEGVLQVVRELAAEMGGARALRAASATASLERDVGLGSLERVELLVRLESHFGRALDDQFLSLDTPAELAKALVDSGQETPVMVPERGPALAAAAAPVPETAATVHEALWRRAVAEPDRPHVHMREEDGSEHTISYGRLVAESRAIAGALRERGIKKGDRVALVLPTGMDFLRCFQGILMARAIPVPVYPPVRLDRLEEYARRQAAILADAEVSLLITIPKALAIAELLRRAVPSLAHVTTPAELAALGASWHSPDGRGTDPAFIQYTSGSTGAPKGVLLTHDNLLANIRAIAVGVGAQPTDVGASWLPLYHDMGLIGSWLFCLYQGIPIAIQSPLAFLSRPERWLWTIHQRRATLSPAPNFAYELCVKKIPDQALEGLDLSSWRFACNGAEPVSPDTLDRFARRFARYGFRREALTPVYGLAENSVALCVPPLGRGPRVDRVAREPFEQQGRAEPAPEGDPTALRFVSVGIPLPLHEVRLVDQAGQEVAERAVGRLAFRGPSMMSGYYRQPDATAAVTLAGGWLDSGDLAYRADGEIYIAGRRKDLIIKAGRNLIPQEIEEVAASVDGIRKGCVVAFGVANAASGTESLVVVAETREVDPTLRDRLAAAVTDRVAAAVGVPPDVVEMVPPGSVPKTSSGKIRRAATKELYLGGALGATERTSRARRLRLIAVTAREAIRLRLRALGRLLYTAYAGATVLALTIVFWIPVALLPGRRPAFALARLGSRLAFRLLGCRFSVEGLENIQNAPRPLLLASNHTSYVDVATLVGLLPLDFLFVSKKEVASWWFVGTFLRKAGHLTVDRLDTQQSVADAARVTQALESGESVLFFPEGTFTAVTGLRPFRLGAFKTAVETGTPVVPLAIRGARRILRANSPLLRPGHVHLWIGPALSAAGDDWRAVVDLRERVSEAIAAHCGEPQLDIVAGGMPRE